MKRRLISLLEHGRADMNEAIAAVERGDVETALGKLRDLALRLKRHAKDLKSNEPGGSDQEATPGSVKNGG